MVPIQAAAHKSFHFTFLKKITQEESLAFCKHLGLFDFKHNSKFEWLCIEFTRYSIEIAFQLISYSVSCHYGKQLQSLSDFTGHERLKKIIKVSCKLKLFTVAKKVSLICFCLFSLNIWKPGLSDEVYFGEFVRQNSASTWRIPHQSASSGHVTASS